MPVASSLARFMSASEVGALGLVEDRLPLLVVEALDGRNGAADTARVERHDGIGVAELLEVLAAGPQSLTPLIPGPPGLVSSSLGFCAFDGIRITGMRKDGPSGRV